MADQFVQVAPDSTGKKVDTSELTVNAQSVERQRMVIADDSGATGLAAVVAKGTQGSFGVAVQELKDGGRTPVTFHCDEVAGIITTEALQTMTVWKGGTSSSTNSYAVSGGKTLRITAMSVSVRNTGATAQNVRARLRWNSGAVATTSAVLASLTTAIPATSGLANANTITIADGYEVPAATNVGISHIGSATTSFVTICVTGFEY